MEDLGQLCRVTQNAYQPAANGTSHQQVVSADQLTTLTPRNIQQVLDQCDLVPADRAILDDLKPSSLILLRAFMADGPTALYEVLKKEYPDLSVAGMGALLGILDGTYKLTPKPPTAAEISEGTSDSERSSDEDPRDTENSNYNWDASERSDV